MPLPYTHLRSKEEEYYKVFKPSYCNSESKKDIDKKINENIISSMKYKERYNENINFFGLYPWSKDIKHQPFRKYSDCKCEDFYDQGMFFINIIESVAPSYEGFLNGHRAAKLLSKINPKQAEYMFRKKCKDNQDWKDNLHVFKEFLIDFK